METTAQIDFRTWCKGVAERFDSLKLRITLSGLGALVLGIGLSTALLVLHAERDTLESSRASELTEAVRTAELLSQRVVFLQRALQAVGQQLDAGTLQNDEQLRSFIASKPVWRSLFSNVYVSDSLGRMRMVADAAGIRRSAVYLGDRPYFQRTVAEQRPIVSEAIAGRLSSEPVVVFTYPLRAEGKVYGVIGGGLRLSSRDLMDDLVDAPESNSSATTVITDAQGRILAHPDRSRVMQTLAGEPRFAQAQAEWIQRGASVEPAGLRMAQPGEVVHAAGVAGPDWMVWRALPEAALFAPLRAARQQALLWAGALVGMLSLAMLALLGWLLRPLRDLEARAARLFDGSLDAHAGWPESGGEIGRLSRVLRHVAAERAQLETFNTQVLQKLGSVMSAAPIGIAFTRAQRFELVSAEFCRLFGRSEEQLLGQPTQSIYAHQADFAAIGPQVHQAFAAGEPYVGEWELVRADGTPFWARMRGRAVDPQDLGAGTIWSVNDNTAQRMARSQLEWSATHDLLTGLANRKGLEARLARVFEARPHSLPAALVAIDLDRFKPINDNAGHAAGDAMLQQVAAAILSCVRASDLVVRHGGDEFVMLLERCSTEVAVRISESVRSAVNAIALPWENRLLKVGASLGVAPLTIDMTDARAWMAAADAACYRAKAEGRDSVRLAA